MPDYHKPISFGENEFDAFIGGGYVDPSGILGVSPIAPAPEPSSLPLISLMLIPAGIFFRIARRAQLPS